MTQNKSPKGDFQPENAANVEEVPNRPGVQDIQSLLQRHSDLQNKHSKLEAEHEQLKAQCVQYMQALVAIIGRQTPPIVALSGNELRQAADVQIITLNDTGDALAKVVKK